MVVFERRMTGDPTIRAGSRGVFEAVRTTCLYAAAILQKQGRMPLNMEAIDATAHGSAEVEFIAADGTQAVLARFVIPERVLTYDPRPIPLPPYEGDQVTARSFSP